MTIQQDLHTDAFPRLTDAQLEALSHCPLTELKKYRTGEKLFTVGQGDTSFYVIRAGEVEIVDESGDKPLIITTHGPGQFTGDVAQLTGRPAQVTAIARGDAEAFEVSPPALRRLLEHDIALADMILQAFLARRQLMNECANFTGLRVIGSRYSQETFQIRDFLAKNHLPYTWLDLENDPVINELLKRFNVTEADAPIVAWGKTLLLRNPSMEQLADALGLRRRQSNKLYDLVIVGAGPSGLAAAVYGASEGLRTIVLERTAPGGQAGRSMRIENYLGFPKGITGAELAERAVVQVDKFGAELPVGTSVTRLSFDNNYAVLHGDGCDDLTARCVLIATGAEYRLLSVPDCKKYEGRGVYYAATRLEAQMCRGSDVIVVGGGNSAGQAAAFLANEVRQVSVVIRGDDLGKNMSNYLVRRLAGTPNIEIIKNSEIQRMIGDDHLTEIELANKKTGERRRIATPAIFSFIGATPRTDWLPPEIEKDENGFVRTGPTLQHSPYWTARRAPFLFETSRPGVFATGDVRSGSIKRVASAVGEGAMAVQLVHEYLKEV